jgi:predicted transcriptional regulator of viral defense system
MTREISKIKTQNIEYPKSITIRDIEDMYGIDFNEKRNIKLSSWLKKKGLKQMAKVIGRIKTFE